MESAAEILKKSYANQSQMNTATLSNDSPIPDDSAEASGLGQPECPTAAVWATLSPMFRP
jgi:hypothetical protein